jgi:sec-independent protein translocase protein TatA
MEIVLILAVLVLLFGAKKLPELARGSGRALRIFKAETKGLVSDDEDDTSTPEQREIEARNRAQAQTQAQTQAQVQPPVQPEARPDLPHRNAAE